MNAYDLAEHYLSGGRDLADTQEDIRRRAQQQALVPVPVRPLFWVSERALEFELEMRRGPRWRCSGCGWLDPRSARESYKYWDVRKECLKCGQPFVERYTKGPVKWPAVIDGSVRTWVLAVAERLGIPLAPAGDAAARRVLQCRQCEEVLNKEETEGTEDGTYGTYDDECES